MITFLKQLFWVLVRIALVFTLHVLSEEDRRRRR
jgi:hypothetical protein